MKFSRTALREALWDESGTLETIRDTIVSSGRWKIHHSYIFRDKSTGKYYLTEYSVGATEQQDGRPWDIDGETVDCVEVEPVQVTVTEYREVSGDDYEDN